MAIGKGWQGICGAGLESAYGAAVAAAVSLPFVSEDFGDEIEKHVDEVLRGKAGVGRSVAGNRSHPFTLPCGLTYGGSDLLIALALGQAGVPAAAGGLYANTYALAEEIVHSATIALHKGVSVWEYRGCKVNAVKISGSANKPLNIEFSGSAKALDLASTVNTAGVLTALAADVAPKVMFSDLTFKATPQAGDLAGSVEWGLSELNLELDNALKQDDFDNRSLSILEPLRDGRRGTKVSFTLPRYEADTWLGWRAADTLLQMQFAFVAGDYQFVVNLPAVTVDTVSAPIGGPGLIRQQIECTAWRDPGSTASAFTCEEEFEIKVVNAIASSPLG